MQFNRSFTDDAAGRAEPAYHHGPSPSPPLTAYGNMQYRDFLRRLKAAWEDANPEVLFVPHSHGDVFNADKAYIVYSLIDRTAVQPKPRWRHEVDDEDKDKKVSIFTHSFENIIKFTAMHQDPTVVEDIIEEFEDFMTVATAILMAEGVEQILYHRRMADDSQQRVGKDIAQRHLAYRFIFQKIYTIDNDRLERIRLKLLRYEPATPIEGATPHEPILLEFGVSDATPHDTKFLPESPPGVGPYEWSFHRKL